MLTKERIPVATYPSSYDMFEERPRPGTRMFRKHLTSTLHMASLVASLLATSLFAAAIPHWNSNFFHNTGPNRGDWTDGMPLGPLVFALVYHAATLVHNRTTRRQRGPAEAVTAGGRPLPLILHALSSALILATLFASLILAAYGSLFRFWRPATRTQSGGVPCDTMLNVFARECQPVLYSVGRLQLAGIVFGAAVWLCHFALFLIALRNLRRHSIIRRVQSEKLAQFSLPRSLSSDSAPTVPPGRARSNTTRAMSLGRSLSMKARQKPSHHGGRRGERTRTGSGSGTAVTDGNWHHHHQQQQQGPGRTQGWYDVAGGGGGGSDVDIQRPTQTLPPVSSRYS
ncbi:uncharacterized protein PV06_06849 [Exophiala oligosperma]|uniref:Uncharacterized protein n=1 Tax=Exophiala oligosperma TaxID=215243 RepID=A0A0D2BUY2_9EURO|nr:uncharacterized protein PV06_06849 [Exophiala oligosperma]KIW41277.1 hypothetical protein PV06_06849 [Exophiala oligosperma]